MHLSIKLNKHSQIIKRKVDEEKFLTVTKTVD